MIRFESESRSIRNNLPRDTTLLRSLQGVVSFICSSVPWPSAVPTYQPLSVRSGKGKERVDGKRINVKLRAIDSVIIFPPLPTISAVHIPNGRNCYLCV